jgi:hypothetical protein
MKKLKPCSRKAGMKCGHTCDLRTSNKPNNHVDQPLTGVVSLLSMMMENMIERNGASDGRRN